MQPESEDHQLLAAQPDLRAPAVTEAAYLAAIPPEMAVQVRERRGAPAVLAAVLDRRGSREPLAPSVGTQPRDPNRAAVETPTDTNPACRRNTVRHGIWSLSTASTT